MNKIYFIMNLFIKKLPFEAADVPDPRLANRLLMRSRTF